jgi:hypothetical protein
MRVLARRWPMIWKLFTNVCCDWPFVRLTLNELSFVKPVAWYLTLVVAPSCSRTEVESALPNVIAVDR